MNALAEEKEIGTVISTLEGPSPSYVDFVVNKGVVHRGQFVEIPCNEGVMICLVNDVVKTNRYFERADSVKEFESNGTALFEQFPTVEWEYLVAKTRPLGVFAEDGSTKRPTFPPSPGARVRIAAASSLERFLNFDKEAGLLLGEIERHNVPVMLNLSALLKKHLAILALSGAGKCVSPSTKVLLSDGSETEIGGLVDGMLSAGFEVEDGVEFCRNPSEHPAVFSLSCEGTVVRSRIMAFSRRKAPDNMVRVHTRTGKVLELTQEHFVPVLDEGIRWLQASELKQGDYLFLPKPEIDGHEQSIRLFNFSKTATKTVSFDKTVAVNEDFARLFAFLLAEGHNNGKMISFTNNSPLIQREFARLCSAVFGVVPKKIKRENEVRIYNKALALALQSIGFTNSSWTKFAPKELLSSKQGVVAVFLGGLIDCDGYVSKNSGLEICLASEKLIDAANSMLLRFGVVSVRKQKVVKGRSYARLSVRGANDLAKLDRALDLLIDYKKERLSFCAKRKSNTNIDIVPKIGNSISETLGRLNMSLTQTGSSGIANYMYRKDNPSFGSLKKLVCSFSARYASLESKIKETKELFYSLPNISENDAKQIVAQAYCKFNFNELASGTGISSTTARRIVRGITMPTKNAFVLAKQAMLLQCENDVGIDIAASANFEKLAAKIIGLCEATGFELQSICEEAGVHKNYLYQASCESRGSYSVLYALLQKLLVKVLKLEENLALAKQRITFLGSIANSAFFFDKITETERFKPGFEYVYDLSVEHSSFTANNLMIHNSYFVSVLLEELLERKKQHGRIATIVLDPHGEYSSFAEPVTDGKHKDYSGKTKLVKAEEIQIGVPKLSVGIVAGIIPGLSSTQKRDLSRIFGNLRDEMRRGVGPFDLNDLRDAISRDKEIKENTKAPLIAWIDNLREMRLFGKTDNPSIPDLIKSGNLTIVDLSNLIDLRKKQVIVSYFAQRLFYERRNKTVPPFLLVLEEAHQFCPQWAKEETAISRNIIRTIAREGRKFGACLCLVSQRPVQLDTTALSQCNTHVILRITNPYDLKHISESSEGLDSKSVEMITSLRVGEALIVGEATHFPVFFKVRKRKSAESRHEISLEKAAADFEQGSEQSKEETEELL